MRSIKPGRGPSIGGIFGSLIMIVFGIFWTIIVFTATQKSWGVPTPIKIFFPLFGVLFVIAGIGNFFYSLHNATAKNRFSVFDITSHGQEPDPIDHWLGHDDSPVVTSRLAPPDEPIEDRLRELDSLKERGLVNEEEYARQRQRILDDL